MTECTAVPNSDARASGGIIVTVGDYVIHTFTDSGYFAATDSTLTEVDVLVVGGGGGGAGGQGNLYGGGGGGGEVVYTANKAINFMTYYVAVGFGGAPNRGTGDASSFAGITANPGSWPTATTGGSSGGGNAGGNHCCSPDGIDGAGGGGGGAGAPGVSADRYMVGGDGGVGIQYNITGTATYYGGGGGANYNGKGGLGGGGEVLAVITK